MTDVNISDLAIATTLAETDYLVGNFGTPAVTKKMLLSALRAFIGTPTFLRTSFRTYATTENFDASTYDFFSLNVTASSALTYNAPTGGTVGQVITIHVRNGSAAALGAITWNAAFKMSSWVNPTSGMSWYISFFYDGTNWVETHRTTTEVPN
jgi:hypothetical protein